MPRNNRIAKPTTKRFYQQIQALVTAVPQSDACGRPIVGDVLNIVWADAAVRRALMGALSAGLLGNSTVVDWVHDANNALNVLVHDKDDHQIVQFGLDPETARPIRLAAVPVGELLRFEMVVARDA